MNIKLPSLDNLNESGFDHLFLGFFTMVLVAVVGVGYLVGSQAATLTTPFKGLLEPFSNASGYCLTANGKTAGSSTVEIQKCSTSLNTYQVWSLNNVKVTNVLGGSSVQEFYIENAASNLCIDDWGHSKASSYPAKLDGCSTSNAVVWIWGNKFTGNKKYAANQIANISSGSTFAKSLCLNDQNSSKANNNPVGLYTCKSTNIGNANQQWFERAAPSQTGGGGSGTTGATSGGCAYNGTVAPCLSNAATGASGWGTPVFDDEFNESSLNEKSWAPSWFNGGKVNSNGVNMSPSNVAVTGGDLVLTLASSSSGATIDTDPSQVSGGFQFGAGYFEEARIYIPGNGSTIYNWPAFWTDGQSWPTDGESDIFEGLGSATSNYHYSSGGSAASNNSGTIPGTWSNGWHTYALDRETGTDYIYWDGRLVRQYSSYDNGSPQYLILSLDCSGGCTTGTASQVKVDYVRVWKKQ